MSDRERDLLGLLGGDEAASDVATGDLQTPSGLLALTALPGIGNGRAIKLARVFRSAGAFNDATPESRKRAAGVSVDGVVNIRELEPPHESTRIVGYFDGEYPSSLRDIKDPPAVLWIRGSLPDPARRIAIVGTRSATPWGLSIAEASARDAAAAGVSVVSGLALGIDIAAHRGALAAGGHTTAVIGSGIDKTTPREHLADAEVILESGGCILTEQSPGVAASARTLVPRNRLQSGLSAATIVVQCGMKSGTINDGEVHPRSGQGPRDSPTSGRRARSRGERREPFPSCRQPRGPSTPLSGGPLIADRRDRLEPRLVSLANR